MTAAKLDSVLAKVKKLLRLAEKAGTPEESATASAMAQKLILEYKLEITSLDDAEKDETGDKHKPLFVGVGIPAWRLELSNVLAEHNSCVTYCAAYMDPITGVQHTTELKIIGTSSNAEILRYMFDALSEQVQKAFAKHLMKLPVTFEFDPLQYAQSFALGMVAGIKVKLQAMAIEVRQEANSQALMRLDNQLVKAEEFANSQVPDMEEKHAEIEQDENGFHDGFKHGLKADIHKGLTSGREVKQLK